MAEVVADSAEVVAEAVAVVEGDTVAEGATQAQMRHPWVVVDAGKITNATSSPTKACADELHRRHLGGILFLSYQAFEAMLVWHLTLA